MRRGQHGGIIFRFLFLMAVAGVVLLLYLARRPVLQMAGNLLVAEDPLEHADAIIVLGDDNYGGDRATRAAQLFRSGLAGEVVASGPMLRPYFGITELMARDLESRGVPAPAVVRFDHRARNTLEEAQSLRAFVTSHGWRRILVVTSNYHTRRARYIFNKVFPATVAVEVAAAQDSDYNPNSWWESRVGAELFFHEAIGYVVAVWQLRKGPPATPPGTTGAWLPEWLQNQHVPTRSSLCAVVSGGPIFPRGVVFVCNSPPRALYSAPSHPVVLPSAGSSGLT